MSNSYERAKALLDKLGTPADRPKAQPLAPANGNCKYCQGCVVWATAPTGKRVPLDFNPEGDLVIVDGVAVSFGPAHEGLRRFVTHFQACRESQKGGS